jgi:hypothetical protein
MSGSGHQASAQKGQSQAMLSDGRNLPKLSSPSAVDRVGPAVRGSLRWWDHPVQSGTEKGVASSATAELNGLLSPTQPRRKCAAAEIQDAAQADQRPGI